MTLKKGNKGEWSEIYVLLKLLGEGRLYAADANLNKIESIFYPLLAIFREEKEGKIEYALNGSIKIINYDGKLVTSIPMADFKKNAEKLLAEIKSSEETTFSCPSLEKFLSSVNCDSIAKGGGKKKDIEIKVHDLKTNMTPVLGFSIKSLLGQKSTLFNAGKNTNFKYELSFKRQPDITELNSNTPSERFKFIKENALVKFHSVPDANFNSNLVLIDSSLPVILAEMLLNKYLHGISDLKQSLEKMDAENPLSFPTSAQPFYSYKIKNFLTDVALGMTPAKVWTGTYDATGGIIVVKKDGDVLCYHIYNRNEFQEYLLNNTKLEQASTTRYDFANIYEENGKFFINLNLQVRFS